MIPGNPQGLPDESFSEEKFAKTNFPQKLQTSHEEHFENSSKKEENRNYSNFSEETIIFIDEAFLSKISKHFGNEEYIKFDRKVFAKNIAKKQKLNCKKIILYTAPPFQNSAPSKDQTTKREGYDKFINKLKEKEIQVREGRCQRLKVDGEFEYCQKAVDVLIAMDLTNVLVKFPKIKKIILISSDSDFVPVIENLKENGVKTILYTYYEKGRNAEFSTSNELIKSVYKYVLLSKEDFMNAKIIKK